jgi:hypothetical protein
MLRHARHVPHHLSDFCFVLAAIQSREDRTEKQPRAMVREDQFVCFALPAQTGTCAEWFSITAAVSTNTFTSPPACATNQRECLRALLDDIVVIALRAHRPRSRRASFLRCERIAVRPVVHPEHDNRAHFRAIYARIATPLGVGF